MCQQFIKRIIRGIMNALWKIYFFMSHSPEEISTGKHLMVIASAFSSVLYLLSLGSLPSLLTFSFSLIFLYLLRDPTVAGLCVSLLIPQLLYLFLIFLYLENSLNWFFGHFLEINYLSIIS